MKFSKNREAFHHLPPLKSDGKTARPFRDHTGIIFVLVFLSSFLVGIGIGVLLMMYDDLPSVEQLEKIEPHLVTRIYSADHVLLKEFFLERRFFVNLEELPPHLLSAVQAAEDRQFYRHWGMNVKRTFAALLQDIRAGEFAQGASTITQQLSRNLFLTLEKSIVRKIKEALTAIEVEKRYTKKEIFEFYLNQIYMGGGAYGIQAASRKFLYKDAQNLTIAESAFMAAMIQRPEAYRPDRVRNIDRAMKRRNWVLNAMKNAGTISEKEYKKAVREPIVTEKPPEKNVGYTPFFTEHVRRHLENKYGYNMLYTGGLQVYTTLEYTGQQAAEDSMQQKLREIQEGVNKRYVSKYRLHKRLKVPYDTLVRQIDSLVMANPKMFSDPAILPDTAKPLTIAQGALLALDSRTGAVLAMIGGRDFNESEFNCAVQAVRQPGSAFKPFVYIAAIDNGMTVSTIVLDQPISVKSPIGIWRPENYDKEFTGPITLRRGLMLSNNIAAIQVIQEVGPKTVIRYARRMGIKQRLEAVPALAIGACEVTLEEITMAYSAIANNGVQAAPYFIERIEDKNGAVLERYHPAEKEVLSPQTAYIVGNMMEDVVNHGTGFGARARGFMHPAGGKTGTTNDYTDAWFIGFTPQITCGVWIGSNAKYTIGRNQTGSKAALPVWTAYMKAAHKNRSMEQFVQPPGIVSCRICTESGKLAKPTCPNTRVEVYTQKTKPIERCDLRHFKKKKQEGRPRLLF